MMLTGNYELPHHFDDVTIISALKSSFLRDSSLWPFNQNEEKAHLVTDKSSQVFPMICGLLLRLRTAMFRVVKRSRMRQLSAGDTYDDRLYRLMKHFVRSDCDDDLLNNWTPATLFLASTELSRKAVYLSPKLQKQLCEQPLLPLNAGTNRLIFDDAFLRQVAEYHAGVQRPDGTFSNAAEANGSELGRNSNVDSLDMENLSIDRLDVGVTAATVANTVVETGRGQRRNPRGKDSQQLRELEDAANMKRLPLSQNEASSGSLIDDLAAVRREKCHVCGCKRQIYCGDCGGVRMVAGGASLPPRFLLPFDVLLVMHWAEDLHQCTGVHAAVLATEGSVEFASWPRTLPRKDRVVQEEVKEVWPKHEKKEFNAQRNLIFRAKKVEVESVPGVYKEKNDDSKDCIDGNENEKEIKCSSGVTSGLTCTNHLDNQDINSNVVHTTTPQITKAPVKQPCNSIRNNDTSGGITAENISEVDNTWGAMVSALDPFRDVILFPSEHAMCASMFNWECSDRIFAEGTHSEKLVDGYSKKLVDGQNNSVEKGVSYSSSTGDDNTHTHRWRLVVLEASWQHGKTMYRQLTTYRALKGLPPLRSVIITGVTGEYWKFHEEGNAAVSTIEAIKHTAQAAGLCGVKCDTLLTLFRLQKLRVLGRVKEGGKAPKAVRVSGEGLGAWGSIPAPASAHANAPSSVPPYVPSSVLSPVSAPALDPACASVPAPALISVAVSD